MLKAIRLAMVAGRRRGLLHRSRRQYDGSASRGRFVPLRFPVFALDALEPRVFLSGAPLFVTSNGTGTVGEFDTSGATINASLVSGFSDLEGVAVSGSTMFLVDRADGVIGEYTTSGAVINANLITGLNAPLDIAVSGSDLFVTFSNSGTVGEFTTSGATVNEGLITGLTNPRGIAVSGSDLFVTDADGGSNGTVGEYTTSGATVNASLVSGLTNAAGVAISGSDLFVGDGISGTIGEFTTSGSTVNPTLISGLTNPTVIVVSGSDLFVANLGSGTIGEYDTSGATINAALISGLSDPVAVAVGSAATTPTTTVLSSTNPSGLGASVTFTATVANSGALPTGSVTFLDGATPIGDSVLDATGTAMLSVSDLTLGTHSITASYPGDANNLASVSAPLTQAVIQPKSIGILDPTFASAGVASNDIGFTATSGLVVQPDGKSVIAGVIGSPGSEQFGVTRYNTDGSVDSGFGDGGVASVGFEGTVDDTPSDIALLPDGSILVAGTATVASGGSEFAIALFDANGNLDPTFGGGTGEILTSFGSGSTDIAHAVVPGLGGEFFVVGSSTASATGEDFALAAYNADGSPATGFNGSGRELVDLHGGNDSANAAVVQPNGDLVVAGSTENPSTDVTSIALARLLPNGAPDSHFGTNGLVVTNLGGVDDEATSVALAPKGAIVVGGESATGSFAAGTLAANFAVLRYTSAGKSDHTFGKDGSVITSFGEDAAVTTVLVQSDGEIIASGKTASDFGSTSLGIGVAEYTTKGTLDPAFNGGKTLITLTGQGATASLQRASAVVTPFDAEDTLRQQFEAFLGSAQGVIATTPGGNLAVAGNSGGFTEVGQLVAIGIDLAAALVAKLPASLKVGAFVSVTISVTETGSTTASDMVSVELFLSGSSSVAAGDTRVFFKPQTLKLKPRQAKSYRIRVKVPGNVTAGKYDFVAEVDSNSQADLNPLNNIAFKGPVQIP